MKKNSLFKYWSMVAILAFVFLFTLMNASVPVQASPALQITPEATVIVPTVVIPNTGTQGAETVTIFSSWVFWVIVGMVLVAIVAALIARPTHTHHDDL